MVTVGGPIDYSLVHLDFHAHPPLLSIYPLMCPMTRIPRYSSIPDKTSAAKLNGYIPHPFLFFKVKTPLPCKPIDHANQEIDGLGNRDPVELFALYTLLEAIRQIGL